MAAAEQAGRSRIILIAPGDVELEVEALRDVIRQANQLRPEADLEVWYWLTDAGPGLHLEGPQGLTDERMRIADADLVVAVFWSRLGTPVAGNPSGTAHELDRAWQAWRQNGRPDVWIYFSNRNIPQSADQFEALKHFRAGLPSEQATWEFTGADDLHDKFSEHLGRWLREHRGGSGSALTARTELLFAPPDTTGLVVRGDQVRAVGTALAKAGLVTVHGLSGSGKTRLAAQYSASPDRLPDHRSALWYEVPEGGTLEELLGELPPEYSGPGDRGLGSRSKSLLIALRMNQSLLVLDDFHNGDRASFAPLLRAAKSQRGPGHLLLVSRCMLGDPDAQEVTVRSWTAGEVGELLRELDLPRLRGPLVDRLVARTGGLPLGVKFFSVLVTGFGRDPERLLDGELAQTHLTETWFSEIKSELSESELTLLRYFSLALPDITEPVSRGALKALPEHDRGRALSRLQALRLVEARANDKWSVHPFVAEHTINDSPEGERRRLLSDLVAFTRVPLARGRRRADLDRRDLAAVLRSCRYAQAADDVGQAAELIDMIAGAAKRLGYYRPLRDRCHWHVVRHHIRYPWIYYHYAHCQLILGESAPAIATLEAIPLKGADPALRYTVARTHAAALIEDGAPDKALAVLREALAEPPDGTKGGQSTYQYARMELARTLVALGELDEAESIATAMFEATDDNRTRAVALIVLGQVDQRRGGHAAVGRFRDALKAFTDVDDRRGMAWARQNLADELLTRYDGYITTEVRRCVRGAISLRLRSGESTVEYGVWLERIRGYFERDPGTLTMIDQERVRLGLVP